jgi:predicted dehydrogenase
MEKVLKLGIIGLSEGNGHPYSWAAIFNGYNQDYMKDCPFPVIPEYLSNQNFPDDCIKGAKVTHIWTQDKEISQHVANASNIENIVEEYEDMIGEVDAILLARDDSEHHLAMAKPFIEAGLPIYIDKPLSNSIDEAEKIYSIEKYEGQIFSCSAIGFASEFKLTEAMKKEIGEIRYIEACVMKDWNKYSMHIIEPVLKMVDDFGKIINISVNAYNSCKTVILNWENSVTTTFKTLYDCKCPIKITVYGTEATKELIFKDTYNAFKFALNEFVQIVKKEKENNSKMITLKAVEIIERGTTND